MLTRHYLSRPALPYQSFSSGSGGSNGDTLSSGAARINTNLRCGNVLPATIKIGFYGDLTGDGIVNQDDGIVYSRLQYPLADWIYRSGMCRSLDRAG